MRAVLVMALLVCACRDQQRPPAPTEEQSAQLNEAENMLNDMAVDQNTAR